MDAVNYLKFIAALVFVLGLIGLFAVAVRRWGLGIPQTPFKRGQAKRLGLVEIMPIDAKRRLVLLKRDDVEHLVMLGASSETVIETHISGTLETSVDFSKALKQAMPEDEPLQDDVDDRKIESSPS